MTGTALRWGHRSDVGQIRQVNQDSLMANGRMFAVADGMGGHRGGEVASEIAAHHFAMVESVLSVDELAEAVVEANDIILTRAANDPNLDGMGTTIVALAAIDDDGPARFAAINVGDSRMYRLDSESFEQVTSDHSLVAELTRAGQLSAEDAANHPQRNVVTRALGADTDVAVDSWVFPARIGERYILCSDGLVNEVSDSAIEAALRTVDDPDAAAEKLVAMANDSGGRDNITVLIVDVVEAGECDPDETPS